MRMKNSFGTQLLHRNLVPWNTGCIRGHVNRFRDLAQKSFSLGTIFAWREIEKLSSLWMPSCFTFLPPGQRSVIFWQGNVLSLFSYAKHQLPALLYVITHSYKHRGGNAFLANSLIRAPRPCALPLVPITKHTLLSLSAAFREWEPHLPL